MTLPFWAILVGVGFVALVAIAAWLRPPFTARGRLFYSLIGLSGLFSGGMWLLWKAALCGYGRPHPPSVPDKPFAEVLQEMFAIDGYALTSIVACIFCWVGVCFCLRAALGPPYRNDLPGDHTA
jgi:hypothetical protein